MAKRNRKDGERAFILYEARAMSGDTENASILESWTDKTFAQVRRDVMRTWQGTPCVLYGQTFKDGFAIEDDSPLLILK
jgi:hypothetical protein